MEDKKGQETNREGDNGEHPLSLASMRELLTELLNDKLQPISRKLDSLNGEMTAIQKQLKEVKTTAEQAEEKVSHLDLRVNSEVENLRAEIKALTKKVVANEAQSRRDNLKFHGIPEKEGEVNYEQCVREIILKKMNVDLGEKAIARAHRVGPPPKDTSGKPRPVLVKFETYKDRCQVWDQKAKLKGSTIYIAEDYPAEVELIRKKLYPIMRAANACRDEAGNRPYQAHLNTDKLIINSRAYTADNLSALPVPIKPENIATKSTQDYVFFWSADSPFSNHYKANFKIGQIKYNCVEQYIMYNKANTFNDHTAANEILAATDPSEQKRLGRHIKNYDHKQWTNRRADIARRALHAKFAQNAHLKELLLKTGTRMLVEASPPWDTTWGVGIRLHDPDIRDRQKWKGKNLLGELLSETRSELS